MKVHEYQARDILRSFGIPVPPDGRGTVIGPQRPAPTLLHAP